MRIVLVFVLVFALSFPVYAQDDGDPEPGDCGNGLPCGPIPWDLPYFPPLQSPTPISESVAVDPFPGATATPTATMTPTLTTTPRPTTTLFFDFDGVSGYISTLSAEIDETPIPIYNVEGTQVGQGDAVDLASNSEVFFSYAKGLSLENTLGPFASFVTLILFFLSLMFTLTLLSFTIPILAVLIGIIRKVVGLIAGAK